MGIQQGVDLDLDTRGYHGFHNPRHARITLPQKGEELLA
jgi:hypothetical protein